MLPLHSQLLLKHPTHQWLQVDLTTLLPTLLPLRLITRPLLHNPTLPLLLLPTLPLLLLPTQPLLLLPTQPLLLLHTQHLILLPTLPQLLLPTQHRVQRVTTHLLPTHPLVECTPTYHLLPPTFLPRTPSPALTTGLGREGS